MKDEAILNLANGLVGHEAANAFFEFRTLLMKWKAMAILRGDEKVSVSTLNKIDCYSLLSAVTGALLKYMKDKKFALNSESDKLIDNYRKIIEAMLKNGKEIIPLGLKNIILAEQQFTKNIVIARKLLINEELNQMIAEILK